MPHSRYGLVAFARRGIAWLLFALIGAVATPALAQSVSTGDLPQLRRHALDLVNRARAEEGLAPLTLWLYRRR